MVLIIATFSGWELPSIDVAQAFLQADDLQQSDKLFVILPPYIVAKSSDQLENVLHLRCLWCKNAIYTSWND